MNSKLKDALIAGAIIVVAIVIGLAAYAWLSHAFTPKSPSGIGAAGDLLAEQYDPYIQQNGGFNTNLPMIAGGGITVTGTTQIGSTGTVLNRVNAGFCYIQPYATTIAATSTGIVDCQATKATGGVTTANDTALAGVSPGDSVNATLATSTAGSLYEGISIIASSASTTAGVIQLYVTNDTGTTFTWPLTGTASGTASYVVTH